MTTMTIKPTTKKAQMARPAAASACVTYGDGLAVIACGATLAACIADAIQLAQRLLDSYDHVVIEKLCVHCGACDGTGQVSKRRCPTCHGRAVTLCVDPIRIDRWKDGTK